MDRAAQIRARIAARVVRSDSGCWVWQGCRSSSGYGTMNLKAEGIGTAHRAAWYSFNGPIPRGLYVLHRCDNRLCANPDHLFLGTAKDNSRDMAAKGRNHSPMRAKTHCPQGHPYDGRNINGARTCRRCTVAAQRRYHERKKENQNVCAYRHP